MRTDVDQIEQNCCHICYCRSVELIPVYSDFYRVTSDCKPWRQGGKLSVCQSCGCVQKIVDNDFYNECNDIYNSYSVYYQGEGEEQRTFEQSKGMSLYRSELILNKVFKGFNLPSGGCLLDIGCGNGNLLKSFSKMHPSWKLVGSELSDRYRQDVERIENVKSFYSCNVENIPGQFDMITMLHCLEHMVDPINYLRKISDKIKPEGFLLIEIPDYTQNPFDLIIADHCTHFDLECIKMVLIKAGFNVLIATNDYIPKELTLLARKSVIPMNNENDTKNSTAFQDVTQDLDWLRSVINTAINIDSKYGNLGVLGTSIAGTWICSELGRAVTFFVDEDPSRVGKEFMGRRVYHPKDVPDSCNVFIAQPFTIACDIKKRLQSYGAEFHLPPAPE